MEEESQVEENVTVEVTRGQAHLVAPTFDAVVRKFLIAPLDDLRFGETIVVQVPPHSNILCVDSDANGIVLFALCRPDEPTGPHDYVLYRTGTIDAFHRGTQYRGTIRLEDEERSYIHIFERPPSWMVTNGR